MEKAIAGKNQRRNDHSLQAIADLDLMPFSKGLFPRDYAQCRTKEH